MILAFFGAFNPPTAAHLELARFALEKTGAEQVVFVPSRSAYIREEQGKDFAYTDEERLAMLRKAAETRPWMAVCDWETRQERQPKTYETLCHLRDAGCPARLMIGSDKLPELGRKWLYVREIVREFGIVCLARGGDACGQLIAGNPRLHALADGIEILETPEETRGVSSTEVRRLIREARRIEKELEGLVPPEIRPLL